MKQKNPSITLIINSRRKLLAPTLRQDLVHKKLRNGLAKSIGWLDKKIRIVQFFEKKYVNKTITDTYGIAIDPGYEWIGFAVYRIRNNNIQILFCGKHNIHTHTVTERMTEKRLYRRLHRRYRRLKALHKFGKAKFRKPRWKNRKSNLLNPTIRYVVLCHLNLIRKLQKYLPITEVAIEYAKFDTQKIQNPAIYGWQYQAGPMRGFEHIRQYVLVRDNYQCQLCKKKNVPLQVHHIIPISNGGTNRPDNLITLCVSCHKKVHAENITLQLPKNQLKSTGVMNTAMPFILKEITKHVGEDNIRRTTGADTAFLRKKYKLQKDHDIDAVMIAVDTHSDLVPQKITEISCVFEQIRQHHDRAKITKFEDRRYYEVGSRLCVAKNRNKAQTQTANSLREYLKKNRSHPNLKVIPARKIYRVNWSQHPEKWIRTKFAGLDRHLFGRGAKLVYYENHASKKIKSGIIEKFTPKQNRLVLVDGTVVKVNQMITISKRGGITPWF